MRSLSIAFTMLVSLALVIGLIGCSPSSKNGNGNTGSPSAPTNLTKTTSDKESTPTFSWDDATDKDSDVAHYLVAIDSGGWSEIGDVTSYTCGTALSDGIHTFKVKAVDEAGNEGVVASLTFTVDASLPTGYGAEANPTGNPIGGGDGYVSPHGYSQSTADYVATTAAELSTALSSATSGDVIWIPSGTTISISTSYAKTLESGVVLASNRGQNGVVGGIIRDTYASTRGYHMEPVLYCQSNSVVSGLTFEGPGGTAGTSGTPGGRRCALRGVEGAYRVEVENCEIYGFAQGGIYFEGGGIEWDSPDRHWIHHCYIHNIQRHGFGYGASESGGCAFLVEGCIFKDCRHHIMAQASYSDENPNNYELRYNYFDDTSYASEGNTSDMRSSSQVDCHGGGTDTSLNAGGTLKIHHNTFTKNEAYETKPNVGIRGIPKTICEVYNNWTKKTNHRGLYTESTLNDAFSLYAADGSAWPGSDDLAQYHMSVHDNWYGSTKPPES